MLCSFVYAYTMTKRFCSMYYEHAESGRWPGFVLLPGIIDVHVLWKGMLLDVSRINDNEFLIWGIGHHSHEHSSYPHKPKHSLILAYQPSHHHCCCHLHFCQLQKQQVSLSWWIHGTGSHSCIDWLGAWLPMKAIFPCNLDWRVVHCSILRGNNFEQPMEF